MALLPQALPLSHCAQLLSHAQHFATPMDYSPPDSSVHGDSPGKNTGVGGGHFLLQGIFQPRDKTCISCVFCIGRQILYREAWHAAVHGEAKNWTQLSD